MLQPNVIRRLVLSRYVLNLGIDHARTDEEAFRFTSINLLQDAIELLLLAAAEHLNIGVGRAESFDNYLTKIAGKIAPKEVPFRVSIVQLNKLRVAAKHDGITPSHAEVERFALIAREFAEEASRVLFDEEYSTVSLIDLLIAGDPKAHCLAARGAYESRDYTTCLTECRKAIFLVFEKRFDVFGFRNEKPRGHFGPLSDAPLYAKDPTYIKDHVNEDTDYIVLDYQKLGQDLVTDGIDPVSFWNVWRLTPEVYQREDKSWTVKLDPEKLLRTDIQQQAAYVLDNTVRMLLITQTKRQAERYSTPGAIHFVTLKADGVPVYRRADKSSAVTAITPAGLRRMMLQYVIRGLNDDETYYLVGHVEPGKLLFGYVCRSDLATGEIEGPD